MPFSIINRGVGWFWCSLLEVRRDALIGPFPSQEEAEKDARATLGIEEASAEEARRLTAHFTGMAPIATSTPTAY
jgi:hypothetical protein